MFTRPLVYLSTNFKQMKKTFITFTLLLTVIFTSWAQQQQPAAPSLLPQVNLRNGFQFSLRGGYDFPKYVNPTPYIGYTGGIMGGASADYYWNWIGLGADFDYIKNDIKNTYPSPNQHDIAATRFSKTSITRMFYGAGPDFRFLDKTRSFSAELNTRVGLGSVNGGEALLTGSYSNDPTEAEWASRYKIIHDQGGYKASNLLSVKGQIRLNYFVNPFWGFNIGAYYMRHFGAEAIPVHSSLTAADVAQRYMTYAPKTPLEGKKDVSSIGIFAGVAYRFSLAPKPPKPVVIEPIKEEVKTYGLLVRARDKFTREALSGVKVQVASNPAGTLLTATTNAAGEAVFNNIIPANYEITGMLDGVALEPATAEAREFKPNKILEKEIYRADDFIVQGIVALCNTDKPMSGITVTVKDNVSGAENTYISNSRGEFTFSMKQGANLTIRGKKENYFSEMITIRPNDYDRRKTRIVKLRICMQEVECNESIRLDNIHYDLDKSDIRPDAKPELDRLVQFMKDNPLVRVELSSHTDSRASKAYNQRLSQARANSARAYVISQGIDPTRITSVGYGESRLLNKCADGVPCTEEEHQLNRRTEMKVICPKK